MIRLNSGEANLTHEALFMFHNQLGADVKHMERISQALRDGESVPMFADGEDGAVAADRMREDLDRKREDVERLMDKIRDRFDKIAIGEVELVTARDRMESVYGDLTKRIGEVSYASAGPKGQGPLSRRHDRIQPD